jgi:hypothetical protein
VNSPLLIALAALVTAPPCCVPPLAKS